MGTQESLRLLVILAACLVAAMTPVATADDEVGGDADAHASLAAPPTELELVPDPPPPPDSDYGAGVGMSGSLAVIGAPGEGSGTVRVFELGDSDASQIGTLTAPAGQQRFGDAVATDGTTIVVGAPGDDEVGGSEAVNIYDPETLALIKTLLGIDAGVDANSDFGSAVAVDGDWLVVGAPFHGEGGEGAVLIYLRTDGVWGDTPFQELFGEAGAGFGYSVAIDGDKIVIGAPFELVYGEDDPYGTEAGAAHLYGFAEGSWAELGSPLTDPDPFHGERFGHAVAIDGDTIAVGGPGEADGDSGRVVVFRDPYGPGEAPPQTLRGDPSGYLYGRSVALGGGRLAVGGLRSDFSGVVDIYSETATAGATYAATTPTFARESTLTGTGAGDGFGRSIAGSGGRFVLGGSGSARVADTRPGPGGSISGTASAFSGGRGGANRGAATGGRGSGGAREVPVAPVEVHPEGGHEPAGEHGKGAGHGEGTAHEEGAAHGEEGAHGAEHPTDRSSFAERLLTPAALDLSFTNLAQGGLIAFLLAALLYLPVIIFNKTTERNHESISAFWAPITRRIESMTALLNFTRRPLVVLLLTGLVSGALFAFVEPGFPTGEGALPYLAGMILGFTFVGAIFFGGWRAVVHKLEPDSEGRWRLYPPYILLAAVLVVVARMAAFLPGVVLGTLAEYEPGKRLSDRTAGLRVLVTYSILLVVGGAAWFAWPAVDHAAAEEGASTLTLVADAALAATFVTALESTVFGLIPLRFLDGHELFTWHKGIWLGLWGLSLYWFAIVIMHPALTTYNHHSATADVFWFALLFSALMLVAVATWVYFAWKHARLQRAEGQT